MAIIKIQMTYDKINEESSKEGDFSEHGFAEQGGWLYPIEVEDGMTADDIKEMAPEPEEFTSISHVCEFFKDKSLEYSCSQYDENGWYTDINEVGYDEAIFSYHVDATSKEKKEIYKRLKKLNIVF